MQQNIDVQALLDMNHRIFGDTRMEGDGDGGDGGAGDGGDADGWKPPASQAELDRIIADRVARTKNQFKDYNDLKSKASKYDEVLAANQTEAEKAQARAEAAEKAVATATERAVKAEIKAIATGEFADPNDAHLYLGDLTRFVGNDGEIDSAAIESALKEIEKSKPHLIARVRTDVGLGARGGDAPTNGNQFMNQQIRHTAGRG